MLIVWSGGGLTNLVGLAQWTSSGNVLVMRMKIFYTYTYAPHCDNLRIVFDNFYIFSTPLRYVTCTYPNHIAIITS